MFDSKFTLIACSCFPLPPLPPVPRRDVRSGCPGLGCGRSKLRLLAYAGTLPFASAGGGAAGPAGMDALGAVMVGTTTAVRGGMSRDRGI